MLTQAVVELVCVIPMLYFYTKIRSTKSSLKRPFFDVILILVVGITLSVGLNNLIAVSPLRDLSAHFNRVNTTIYADKRIWQVLAVGICAPFLEEVTFRGVLFGNLRKALGSFAAIVLSALIFGAMHYNIVQFVYATGLGIAFAYIYEKTGELWTCVLAHSVANLFSLVATWYGISAFFTQTKLMCMISGMIGCAIAIILLARWKKA